MKRYFSLILAIAATVSAQIVPSTGNVRGPTSATDNAVARYDGTTGKLIQNSGVTIDDSSNLTVSGTGTSSFSGSLSIAGQASTINNSTLVVDFNTSGDYGRLLAKNSGGAYTTAIQVVNPLTVQSNLTVSGTGTSSVAGVFKAGTDIVTGNTSAFQVHNNVDDKPMIGFYRGGTLRSVLRLNTDNDFRLLSSDLSTLANLIVGNLLIGTTTDTGYKLNVKGASDAQMMLDVASGSQYTTLAFANNGSGKGFVYWDNTNNGLFAGTYASNASLKFNTGLGVLALTLDSSQNASFAGSATIGDGAAKGLTVNSGSGQNLFVMKQAGESKWVQYLSSGSLAWYNSNLYANALILDTATSNATFAGAIAIGNTVNTVSPTSPNRTITMVIGGTTYYIHAKTTND